MKLAVTGVGIVSPLGHNLELNLNNLKNMEVPLVEALKQMSVEVNMNLVIKAQTK